MVVSAGYTPSLLRTICPSLVDPRGRRHVHPAEQRADLMCRVDDAPVGRRGPVEPLVHSLGPPRVLCHADQLEPVRTEGFVELLPDRQADAAASPR